MPDYQLFGGLLRSDLVFPELIPATSGYPRWFLSRRDQAPPLAIVDPMGAEEVEAGVYVTLSASKTGMRLDFDDTGIFEVSGDGRTITWTPSPTADLASVRQDVLGRVFAVVLQQEGVISLHGSAVALDDVAVAFLAPKFHGKSTAAAALVSAGGRLLADDLVAVTSTPVPMVMPSVPVLQLWHDSAERVARATASVRGNKDGPKLQMAWTESERNATTSTPLAAMYLLSPVQADALGGVRRHRLSGVHAALALLGQAKIGTLVGVEKRSFLLAQMLYLADRVPVYRLEVPRDFARIPEFTSQLLSWHDAFPPGESARSVQ